MRYKVNPMRRNALCTLDFESEGIESRPEYPPRPVGLAFSIRGGLSGYLAWGHPCENNATAQDAGKLLRSAFRGEYGPCVFHNAIFDIDLAMTFFDLDWPVEYHDTMALAFLNDPHAQTLSLKPLAAKYLHRKAYERDELMEWLVANVRVDGKKITAKQAPKYISLAPGKMVGRYASADVLMTEQLFDKLYVKVANRGMLPAYERELNLMPTTLEMERTGLLTDQPGLIKLEGALSHVVENHDRIIRRTLNVGADFNVDSGPQLGEALVRAGKLSKATYTATGKQSTAKDTLIDTCNDPVLVKTLSVRSAADKYLTGFVRPWIDKGSKNCGYIQPRFNQFRNRSTEGGGGALTGRYSSADPNFQNIPSNIEDSPNRETLERLFIELQLAGLMGFRGLRDYFLVDPGKIWAAIDYSQQELRILGHFEGGQLMAQYNADPKMNFHKWVAALIKTNTGIEWPHKFIKTCVFMLLYGGGAKKLAAKLKIPLEEAYKLRATILAAVPGVKKLMDNTKGPIVTWGGRHYEVEPPTFFEGDPDSEGEWVSWEYKQLNKQIQGSAADCTKVGMLNVRKALPDCRIAVQVHDELGIMVEHKDQVQDAIKAMCNVEFLVPMLAEAKLSTTTWARAA